MYITGSFSADSW